MPKINSEGATYAGHEGIVENAEGKLSEVNPEKETPDDAVMGNDPSVITEPAPEPDPRPEPKPGPDKTAKRR